VKPSRRSEHSDAVFKALADPSRRKLLDRLHARNGQTLGELCAPMDMARQSVTRHLALLEAANLVTTRWRGREKLHYLNVVPLQQIHERWIRKFERSRLQALEQLRRRLEEGDDE
jgi:DNA-binding transcriptional ArsR family regulator